MTSLTMCERLFRPDAEETETLHKWNKTETDNEASDIYIILVQQLINHK